MVCEKTAGTNEADDGISVKFALSDKRYMWVKERQNWAEETWHVDFENLCAKLASMF